MISPLVSSPPIALSVGFPYTPLAGRMQPVRNESLFAAHTNRSASAFVAA